MREMEWWKASDSKRSSKKSVKWVPRIDVLVTTYEIAMQDIEVLCEIKWGVLVVDESQRLKNRMGKLFEKLCSLDTVS